MKVLKNIEVLKLIVPVATFILGSMFTLLIEAIKRRRDALQVAARDAVRLTKDWYNQIQGLWRPPEEGDRTPVVYDYVHSRFVLPELMLTLRVLKRYRKADRLVRATEEFLDTVTGNIRSTWNTSVLQNPETSYCLPRADLFGYHDEKAEAVLRKLDGYVQQIAREAAQLL